MTNIDFKAFQKATFNNWRVATMFRYPQHALLNMPLPPNSRPNQSRKPTVRLLPIALKLCSRRCFDLHHSLIIMARARTCGPTICTCPNVSCPWTSSCKLWQLPTLLLLHFLIFFFGGGGITTASWKKKGAKPIIEHLSFFRTFCLTHVPRPNYRSITTRVC